jgi:hypothetical protein
LSTQKEITMIQRNHRKAGTIAFLALTLLVLTACGTIEVGIVREERIEQPHSETPMPPESVPVGTSGTQPTVEISLERVITPVEPTPTSAFATPEPARPAFTPMAVEAFTAPDGLRVALIKEGDVWLWAAEAKTWVRLTTGAGADGDVRITDDGVMLAFTRGDELWAVNSDGSSQRLLVSVDDLVAMDPPEAVVRLHGYEWVPGTHVLAYNTHLQMAIGLVLNDDLHLVDADTLEHTELLPPGQGGEFYYSPDGSQIAIVTRGDISLVDADGGNRRDAVLTYTPVATYSEVAYYAQPVWAPNSRALRVAIPPADPRAAPGQHTTIWHIPSDGSPAGLVTSIDVAPILGPHAVLLSPDLNFVAYAQLRQPESGSAEDAQWLLQVQRLDNGDWIAFPHPSIFHAWAPDSRHFAFQSGLSPHLLIGQWSGPTKASAVDAGTPISDLRWIDAGYHLFLAQRGAAAGEQRDAWELILSDVHGSNTILTSAERLLRYDLTIAKEGSLPLPFLVTPTPMPTPDVSLIEATPTPTREPPSAVIDVQWDTSPSARIVRYYSPSTTAGMAGAYDRRYYVPEVQVWGNGRIMWVVKERGSRRVLEGQLTTEQMKALLQRIVEAGFFGWEERYYVPGGHSFPFMYLEVNLTRHSKEVAEHGGAPEAFYELVELLEGGAAAEGHEYVPTRGYLTATGLGPPEQIGATPEAQWPETTAGFALNEVGDGRYIEGEALAFAWQAVNQYTRAPVYVESKGDLYTIMVQIPGVSYAEPPAPD